MKYVLSTRKQSGVMLLEALIGILIFSIGILAIVGLQAASIRNQADAKYRGDASYFVNQIIGQIWVDRANLATYAHNPTPVVTAALPASCNNPTNAPSANANVTAWTTKVANGLPGATAAKQQIIIGAGNQVTVVLRWQRPQDASCHKYIATTYIN